MRIDNPYVMSNVINSSMLKLPSNPKSLTELEAFVKRIASKYDICSERYPDILISLTEAVNNAIIHGNEGNDRKTVAVTMIKKEEGISFKVSDEGNGFNPHNIPNPTLSDKLECCGGRGVFIIKELCDKVSFRNNGSTIEMFFLDPC